LTKTNSQSQIAIFFILFNKATRLKKNLITHITKMPKSKLKINSNLYLRLMRQITWKTVLKESILIKQYINKIVKISIKKKVRLIISKSKYLGYKKLKLKMSKYIALNYLKTWYYSDFLVLLELHLKKTQTNIVKYKFYSLIQCFRKEFHSLLRESKFNRRWLLSLALPKFY
jgi:hypothetical protein